MSSKETFHHHLRRLLGRLPSERPLAVSGLGLLAASSAFALAATNPEQGIALTAAGFAGAIGQNALAGILQTRLDAVCAAPDADELARLQDLATLLEPDIRRNEKLRFELGVLLQETDAFAIARAVVDENPAQGWLLVTLYDDLQRLRTETRADHAAFGAQLAAILAILHTGLQGAPRRLFAGVPALPPQGLYGRDALMAEILTRLSAGGAVSLATSGAGGKGKTALAVALAYDRRLSALFPDGVLFASLGPGGEARTALNAWATALQIDPAAYPEAAALAGAIRAAISDRRLLLILDDIWDAAQAELLRCGGPGCAHLLTTRHNKVAAAFALGNALDVPDLEPDDGFDLLRELAPAACAADEGAARGLVAAVGGLPLAIMLLGGFLGKHTPDPELFPEESRAPLLDLGDPARRLALAGARLGDVSGEKQALSAVLGLSLAGLTDAEREAYDCLGAFAPKPAAFSVAAARAVCAADAATLSLFLSRNLLEKADGGLVLHQVPADFLRPQVPEEAVERHADYYLELAQVNDPDRTAAEGEEPPDWRRIEAAYAQIEHAWNRVSDAECIPWVGAVCEYQRRRGLFVDVFKWLERGLSVVHAAGEREDEAALLNRMGWAYQVTGRPVEALSCYDQSLEIVREIDNRLMEAAALSNMGALHQSTGNQEEALALYGQALTVLREAGDPALEVNTLISMSEVYRATGRPEEALALLERALPITRSPGKGAEEATTLNNMGAVQRSLGRPERALTLYEEALPILREVGDRAGEAATLNNMGEVYREIGRPEQALAFYQQALPILRKIGDRAREATALGNMGEVYSVLGQYDKGYTHFVQALSLSRKTGNRAQEGAVLMGLGTIQAVAGDIQGAIRYYQQSLLILRDIGDRGAARFAEQCLNNLRQTGGRGRLRFFRGYVGMPDPDRSGGRSKSNKRKKKPRRR